MSIDFNEQPSGAVLDKSPEMTIGSRSAEKVSRPSNYNNLLFDHPFNPTQASDGNEADKGVMVEFYFNPYDDQHHIKMVFPGDKRFMPDYPVNEVYKKRFASQWEAYIKGENQNQGIMLAEIDWLSREQLGVLSNYKIYTMEQLANVADSFLTRFDNGRELKEKAVAYLANTRVEEFLDNKLMDHTNSYDSLKKENKELRAANAENSARLDEMQRQISQLLSKPDNAKRQRVAKVKAVS